MLKDCFNGINLLRRRIGSAGDIRRFKIGFAVDIIAHILIHFDAHQFQRRILRAHQRKDFFNLPAILAIDHMAPLTLQLLWRKRQFIEQLCQISADIAVRNNEFEMIVLFRIGQGPTGEKSAP